MRLYRNQYPGRDGKTRRSRNWTYDFVVNGRRYKGSTGFSDKLSASQFAQNLYREAQQQQAGIEVKPLRTAEATVEQVADSYARELERRRRTAEHVRETRLKILVVARHAGAATLRELAEPSRIEQGLAGLVGRAPKTINEHRAAVGAMFSWLVRTRAWPNDPVSSVDRVQAMPTRRTRAFSDDELRRLLAAGPGKPGLELQWQRRRATYVLAVSTGLRAGEIGALVRGDFDLEAGTVTVRAASAKSRREEVLPLPADALADLRPFLERHLPSALPFWTPGRSAFLRDLERAKIQRETEEGRVDFHGLRRTYSTRLARAGVPMAVHQRLMRHTDPRVTMAVYTRLQLVDGRAAARAIEGLLATGGKTGGTEAASS